MYGLAYFLCIIMKMMPYESKFQRIANTVCLPHDKYAFSSGQYYDIMPRRLLKNPKQVISPQFMLGDITHLRESRYRK
jgi:hypothetical protein